MIYTHVKESIPDKRNRDRIAAETTANKAMIDYIAMEVGVEIPENNMKEGAVENE